MTPCRVQIPVALVEPIIHGLELAVSVIPFEEGHFEGRTLHSLATQWFATINGYVSLGGLLPNEAASLRAVLVEAVEYAMTHNYGNPADFGDFPKDVTFARVADDILAFLAQASRVTFARRAA